MDAGIHCPDVYMLMLWISVEVTPVRFCFSPCSPSFPFLHSLSHFNLTLSQYHSASLTPSITLTLPLNLTHLLTPHSPPQSHLITHSPPLNLTHSLIHSLTTSPSHKLTLSLFTHTINHSFTISPSQSHLPTQPPNHSFAQSLTHTFTHPSNH